MCVSLLGAAASSSLVVNAQAAGNPDSSGAPTIIVFYPGADASIAPEDIAAVRGGIDATAATIPSTRLEPRTATEASAEQNANCATDAACLAAIGRSQSVRWVASGSLLATDTGYRLVYVVVDVDTESIVDSSSVIFHAGELATEPGALLLSLLSPQVADSVAPTATDETPESSMTVIERPVASATSMGPFAVGIELGAFFPQLVSKLDTSLNTTVELGYLLPILEPRLAVYTNVAYTQPSRSGSMTDPRLADGAYDYQVTEQHLVVNLGGLYRIYPPGKQLNFYGQLGLRLDLQRSKVSGDSGGATFGENQENATKLGLHAAVGTEYRLGPGALAGELDMAASGLSQYITGDTTAGGLSVLVGYHYFF